MKGLINFWLSVQLVYVHASTIFFYDNTKLISLRNICAIVKTAGTELCMICEDVINNAENLFTDGYNMKCLFILHLIGKCILTQY